MPQDHIGKKVRDFPDELKRRRQIQQFFEIIIYASSHIPHISSLTSPILRHLKKKATPWSSEATLAIIKIKENCKALPP